jgi:DNA-binding transcriptional MerR regulator
MTNDASERLLSIGGFAAATQLSLKALRLYDEQQLLRPASVDPANGYRYYRRDQIAAGRLIRLLREMDLPLADITAIVVAEAAGAETALHQCAHVLEQRFTRQRRAYRAALAHLRHVPPSESPTVSSQRPAANDAVVSVEFAAADPVDLTAGIDTLFDWFDRRGHRAVEPPAVTFTTRSAGITAEVHWAYV